MADIKKQCARCHYWMSPCGSGAQKFCHHLLHTGKRRVEVDGVCKSHTPRKRKGGTRK